MAQEGDDGLAEQTTKTVFASYVCRSKPSTWGAVPHCGDVAEATSLSSVMLPATDYPLLDSLPRPLMENAKLSQLQLEGILYACTKHLELLPTGKRAGFFLGDGAGIGKGRQIAGCIIDSYARGRKQHAWLSISSDLHLDAQRDLTDLGCYIKVINNVQTLDKETKALGLSSDFKEGVLFLTYSSLISKIKGKSRIDQIVQWLGGSSFEGLLVFDECHKAKNFTPGNEASSTKIATCVLELQNRLPMARVLYASATGVSEVGNMAYMDRMNLWGSGTAFHNFEQFLSQMKNQSISFLELLAMEMKAEGKYVARGLSFKDAEFSEIECTLTPEQVRMYDAAVAVWAKVKSSLQAVQVLTGKSSRDVMKTYWATVQRFFKLLCVSLKVPRVVAEAKEAIQKGYCVVVGLQTTGEAADASLGLEPGPVPGMVSTTKEMLVRFVAKHICPDEKDKGHEGHEMLDSGEASEAPDTLDAVGGDNNVAGAATAGTPREGGGSNEAKTLNESVARESKCIQQELFEAIQELELPPNFLDEIIDELGGPSQVAEMTGRRGRIVRNPKHNRYMYELRAKPDTDAMDSLNVVERGHFQNGLRNVAVISDAASTGISLHASRETPNPKRRLHLTIELPWSADKAIQQLGRTHRSNQASAPVYRLLSTSVGGEKRFSAAVARRLQSLGALTRGDRRAASGVDLSDQNFDSPLGRRSLRRMYDHILLELPTLPPGADLINILKEFVKTESGRPDMDDAEAEALTRIDDPELKANQIVMLHKQLRQYVDMMGVELGSTRKDHKDTVAEEGDPATAAKGRDRGKGGRDTLKGKETGDVKRFLNRLLALPVAEQNLLFTYFTAVLAAEIRAAKQEGKYSEGLADLFGSHATRHKKAGSSGLQEVSVLWTDPLTGLRTYKNEFYVDRGMSWEAAMSRLQHESVKGDYSGFRISRRPFMGKHSVCLALQKPGARNIFSICRPNTGDSFLDFERDDLESKYQHVNLETAEAEWRAAYEYSLDNCTHGFGCKQGPSCTYGKRITPVTVLSGSVVRVWSVLEAVLARHEHELSKTDRAMRVVRAAFAPSEANQTVSAAPTPTKPPGLPPSHSSSPATKPAPITDSHGAAAATPAAQADAQAPADTSAAANTPPSTATAPPAAANASVEFITAPQHVVGVRYPAVLLPEVEATLSSLLHAALDQASQSGKHAAVAAGIAALSEMGASGVQGTSSGRSLLGGGHVEPPAKVDTKVLARAFRKPPTINDFFKKQVSTPSASQQRAGCTNGSSSNSGSKVGGPNSGGAHGVRGNRNEGTAKSTGRPAGAGGAAGKKQQQTSGGGTRGALGGGGSAPKQGGNVSGQRSLADSFLGGGSSNRRKSAEQREPKQEPPPQVEMMTVLSDSDEDKQAGPKIARAQPQPQQQQQQEQQQQQQEPKKRGRGSLEGQQAGGTASAGTGSDDGGCKKGKHETGAAPGSTGKEHIQQLLGMGFERRQAERAVLLAKGNLDKAVELCLGGM